MSGEERSPGGNKPARRVLVVAHDAMLYGAQRSLLDICLLYTSDAADERSSVDLGGRRIIKKKKTRDKRCARIVRKTNKEEHERSMNGPYKDTVW